ncbi:hypothetical protein [Amycolatopsis sp. ATCC 39116]|uniref:hypothetical protein n=1 Tax=Amycolatopsis sp. (strain ATCC 39116 / 75iv2) TaxID=385957 RepID=UPI0012FC6927|nr:hypothetical protein [Amycolatopsis sp. ATCC 39116]
MLLPDGRYVPFRPYRHDERGRPDGQVHCATVEHRPLLPGAVLPVHCFHELIRDRCVDSIHIPDARRSPHDTRAQMSARRVPACP